MQWSYEVIVKIKGPEESTMVMTLGQDATTKEQALGIRDTIVAALQSRDKVRR